MQINTLFFTILFTLFDRNVTLIIFPLTTICEYFPETSCSTEFQYNLYTGMHFIISMINASILTKMHSASYDLQFCSLSKICSNTIKYSKLVYILKYQRFKFRTVLDLAVAKPICYDGFNRNSSDESIYKASRWSRLCPTKEKVPLWLNHAIFRGIIFYETVVCCCWFFFLPLISPSSSNYFFEFLVY